LDKLAVPVAEEAAAGVGALVLVVDSGARVPLGVSLAGSLGVIVSPGEPTLEIAIGFLRVPPGLRALEGQRNSYAD